MNVTPPSPLAVLLAFVSTFMLGGLWYAPFLFGRRWQALVGITDERIGKKAAARAPPELRMLIERCDSDYRLGLEQGQADEGTSHDVVQGKCSPDPGI